MTNLFITAKQDKTQCTAVTKLFGQGQSDRVQSLLMLVGSYTPPRKHLPEITFPQKTLGQNYIIPNIHFPERAFSKNYISLNVHLPEITLS